MKIFQTLGAAIGLAVHVPEDTEASPMKVSAEGSSFVSPPSNASKRAIDSPDPEVDKKAKACQQAVPLCAFQVWVSETPEPVGLR